MYNSHLLLHVKRNPIHGYTNFWLLAAVSCTNKDSVTEKTTNEHKLQLFATC